MSDFFERLGIGDLFDGVFVSSEEGVSKHRGDLYPFVLSRLGLQGSEVLMMGDNHFNDVEQAKRNGLNAVWKPQRLYLLKQKIAYRLKKSSEDRSSERLLAAEAKRFTRDNDAFEEYILVFYQFIDRLYRQLVRENIRNVVFLSREGHELKHLFDRYQEICVPAERRIPSRYFLCSRRAIFSVQPNKTTAETWHTISVRDYFKALGFDNDEIDVLPIDGDKSAPIEDFAHSREYLLIHRSHAIQALIEGRRDENIAAFRQYLSDTFPEGEQFAIVDVGWTGNMQQGIEHFLQRKGKGFYVGVTADTRSREQCDRTGLVFHRTTDEQFSPFYHLLRVNTMLHELLLSAPHGSAQHYRLRDGRVEVVQEWEENEKALYEHTLSRMQERMRYKFDSLCISHIDPMDDFRVKRILARMCWRNGMLLTPGRYDFMRRLCQGFVNNAGATARTLTFDTQRLDVSKRDVLCHPDRYARYFVKLPLVYRSKLPHILLTAGLYVIYRWVYLHSRIAEWRVAARRR